MAKRGLAELLRDARYTTRELSEESGVHYDVVIALIHGSRGRQPNADKVLAMAKAVEQKAKDLQRIAGELRDLARRIE